MVFQIAYLQGFKGFIFCNFSNGCELHHGWRHLYELSRELCGREASAESLIPFWDFPKGNPRTGGAQEKILSYFFTTF